MAMQVATFILKGSIREARADSSETSEDEEDMLCSVGHRSVAPAMRRLWRTFPVRLSLGKDTADGLAAHL